MFAFKGDTHKCVFGVASAALAAGLVLSPGALAAAPVAKPLPLINQTDAAGNTTQVVHNPDAFKSQFSLWPLGDNNATVVTHGNVANNGGNGVNGIPWLLGNGAGNVFQVGNGGNVVASQVGAGVDNHLTITTWGNEAINNGNGSNSLSGGQTVGHVIDGNGNVMQLVFFQGNVLAPQLAVDGDNHAVINSYGNYAQSNGNGSSQAGNGGALALVDGNGNIVQFMVLSNNVVAPQVAVNGSNDLVVHTEGNGAYDNGNGSSTTSTKQTVAQPFGIPGVFTVTTIATGNGNVTQVALLSNNVLAPQLAIPGPKPGSGSNTSKIDTLSNDSQANGNGSETDSDNAEHQGQVGNGNTRQWVRDTAAIFNPQVGVKPKVAVAAPVAAPAPVAKVADPEPAAEDSKPLVRESFIAIPGDQPADSGGSKKKPAWKPGDGIKKVASTVNKVVNDVSNALKPKPKPAP